MVRRSHTAVKCLRYFTSNFAGSQFHAMVVDKVIDHLQFVEEGFFVERFAPGIKPNRVKNFLYSTLAKLAFSVFFVVFFEASHRFDDEAEPSQRSEHDGVQSDAPGNR